MDLKHWLTGEMFASYRKPESLVTICDRN